MSIHARPTRLKVAAPRPPAEAIATTVRVREGKTLTTDGPGAPRMASVVEVSDNVPEILLAFRPEQTNGPFRSYEGMKKRT